VNLFKTDSDSHAHSLQTLNLIANYDDFMDSIETIVDMGCGAGDDIAWWAAKTYLDDNDVEQPYNYNCIGIDTDISRAIHSRDNLKFLRLDFEEDNLLKADVIWSHDTFRYATNPVGTLALWNKQLNANGMLAMAIPQTVNIAYNKPVVRTLPNNYFHYTITNLIYMLAVSGFDCKEGHFMKLPNDPWLHCVVYKSEYAPMNPKTTTWYDLVEKDMLPQTAADTIKLTGFLKQEGLQTHWLNGQYCNWGQV